MTSSGAPLRVRRHGPADGPVVAVLHGGPGAPGAAVGLARGLADPFCVLEPFQRRSGAERLTVAGHVEDLDRTLREQAPGARPALVGESWGAMLALAYAAEHPGKVAALGLVGCGTFDPDSRAELQRRLTERTTPALQAELAALAREIPDEAARLERAHALSSALYDCEPDRDPSLPPPEPVDGDGHRESWADMLRLQQEGAYPARFSAIRCPVLMLHGDFDPHPGPRIREGLRPHLPQLEYVELARCGHSPWHERHARDPFFAALRGWLAQILITPGRGSAVP